MNTMKKMPNQPKVLSVPESNGYPNNVANTQTKKMRGVGVAIKGTGFSGKSN